MPLLGPQGIFKPAILPELPLSITTAPIVEGRDRPYDDDFGPHGLLVYRYRGTDPQHRDNVALRLARQRAVPLISFVGLVPGEYLAVWPVFVVGDDPGALAFTIEVEAKDMPWETAQDGASLVGEGRRRYITPADPPAPPPGELPVARPARVPGAVRDVWSHLSGQRR